MILMSVFRVGQDFASLKTRSWGGRGPCQGLWLPLPIDTLTPDSSCLRTQGTLISHRHLFLLVCPRAHTIASLHSLRAASLGPALGVRSTDPDSSPQPTPSLCPYTSLLPTLVSLPGTTQ